MINPCHLCEKRFLGCHAKDACPEGEAWKAEQEAKKKARQKDLIISEYRSDSDLRWRKRKKGKK